MPIGFSVDRVDRVDEGDKVTINEKPRLCGGTFFALLLDAKVEAMSQREHRKGHRDKRIIPNLMSKLLWVMTGNEVNLADKALETFGSNVNKYRLCKIDGGAHVPLKRTDAEVKAFDRLIREDYSAVLHRMDEFLQDTLDFREDLQKPDNLVKALMDTVSQDRNCDNKEFFVLEDGDSIPGVEVIAMKEICLPAFILGMWHAALMIPEKNSEGLATINEWCPSTGGGHRSYSGSMGENWPVKIEIKGLNTTVIPKLTAEEVEEDTEHINGETIEDTEEAEPGIPYVNQFLAKPKANVHYGSGDIYSDIQTLTINKNYYGDKNDK